MRTAMVSLVLEEGVGIKYVASLCVLCRYCTCLLLAPALLLVSCVDQNQKRRVPELCVTANLLTDANVRVNLKSLPTCYGSQLATLYGSLLPQRMWRAINNHKRSLSCVCRLCRPPPCHLPSSFLVDLLAPPPPPSLAS